MHKLRYLGNKEIYRSNNLIKRDIATYHMLQQYHKLYLRITRYDM